jgi:UrcA family protein
MKTSILTLALGASVLAFAATPATSVFAQDTQTVSAVVKFGDLNLSSREGAKTMYHRIRSTAFSLCGDQPDISDITGYGAWRACVNDAINGAVGRLNAPMVTALNGGRTSSSVQLAQAR